jgi:hypothetical protein
MPKDSFYTFRVANQFFGSNSSKAQKAAHLAARKMGVRIARMDDTDTSVSGLSGFFLKVWLSDAIDHAHFIEEFIDACRENRLVWGKTDAICEASDAWREVHGVTPAVARFLNGYGPPPVDPKRAVTEVSMPTRGKTGGNANKVSIVSFPGAMVSDWNAMVGKYNWYNYAVVYDKVTPDNKELAKRIQTDPSTWDWPRMERLLHGENWFQLWLKNVHTERRAGKKLIVIAKPDGSLGNYQKAERHYLRLKGISFSMAPFRLVQEVNEMIAVNNYIGNGVNIESALNRLITLPDE